MKKLVYITLALLVVVMCSYAYYEYTNTTTPIVNGFAILDQDEFFDTKGWFHIEGKIKNIEKEESDTVRIMVEFFNKDNGSLGQTVYYFDENFSKNEIKDYDVFRIDDLESLDTYKFTILR